MLLVYRYRIKSLTGLLGRQARACNFVWNFCNETQQQALKWNKRWPTGFDLNRLTAGSSKELALHARTINAVCEQYAKSRRQRNRPFLRWRGRRSLGWVPLKGCDLKRSGDKSFSTRVCSFCDCKTGPKGVADLGIRSWVCAVCGVSHDRDINSARNILFRSGHRTPAEGILAL
jgi:hypothetical protein